MAEIPELKDQVTAHGWIKEAVQEAEGFLKAQQGYNKISESMKAVFGEDGAIRSSKLSDTEVNRIGKISSDLASLLTDIKPFWEYETYNKRFERQQTILGKLSTHWYHQRLIDLRMNEVVKYYTVAGTGFPHVVWEPSIQDFTIYAEDPRDVLPIRPPAGYTSIQDCQGVALRREHTVNYLRSIYPESLWHLIVADRDGSLRGHDTRQSRFSRMLESFGVTNDNSPFMQRLWGGPARKTPQVPMVDLYTVYLKDDSRNETSQPKFVGEFDREGRARNNWSYIVPPGMKMYPRGRRIVATSRGILKDGPNIYWHGLFPLPKMTLDPWPWSWFGKAPLWDLLKMQGSLNRVLRIVDDKMEQIARPGLIADKNSVSRAALEKYDTRRAGFKFQHNPIAGKGLQVAETPPLPREVFGYIEYLETKMDELSGVRDLSQLMNLNQVPGADTIEKITASMTATVRGRSRALESFFREFGTMMAYNFAQFYTMPMRMTILGQEGVTKEDFDFDPGTFIPDYVHREDFDERGIPTAAAMARGPLPSYDRANEFLRQFSFHVAPGSLLAASEIERKLLYLQLMRAGLIDHWTLLEMLGIPNVGMPPEGANTITDRLMAEQQMQIGPNINPVGRKATGQTMPRMSGGKVVES